MKKILQFSTTTWFIALVIALIIFAFTYQHFKEYSIEKISEEGKNFDDYRFFYDVDNDSIDDNIDISFNENINSKEIVVTNSYGKNLNITVIMPYKLPNFFREAYSFSEKKDGFNSLVHVMETDRRIFLGITDFDTLPFHIYLDTISRISEYSPNTYDYGFFGSFDVNNDGYSELYMYVAEGYRIFPRRLYCIDIHNKKVLFKSKQMGAFPINYEQFMIDSLPYFVVGSQAVSNMISFSDFYLNDLSSYFIVLDKNLNFQFEPIKMGGNASRVYFFKKEIEKTPYFITFANPYDEALDVEILQIDLDGNIVKTMQLPVKMEAVFGGIFSIENNIFYLDNNKKYHKFNFLTESDDEIEMKFAEQPFWLLSKDIDNDGKEEHLFRDKSSNKIYITRNNFSKPAQIELPLNEVGAARYYFPNYGDKNLIFVWTYTTFYTFEYIQDPLYLLKLLGLITALFIAAYIFLLIIQAIVKYRLQQKSKITSRIKELEFQNVRSQMNPHFTLNTLNFISTSILKNEKEKAYDVISGFSNIIRSTLLDANKILRNLDEELKFVEDYLTIQKARFSAKFDYKINIQHADLMKITLPPFMIQIFVENSLKHGLKTVKSGGKIIIDVIDNGKNAEIFIKDNGIGRKAAKNNSSVQSTGKGLKLTKEYIELINSLNKEKIILEYIDSFEGDTSKGFTVKVTVPKTLKSQNYRQKKA